MKTFDGTPPFMQTYFEVPYEVEEICHELERNELIILLRLLRFRHDGLSETSAVEGKGLTRVEAALALDSLEAKGLIVVESGWCRIKWRDAENVI